MKIKKEKKTKKYLIITLLTMSLSVMFFLVVRAEESITEIPQNTENVEDETQEKIKELEKKAEIYRQIIEIKQKQAASLNNQISLMDSNIQEIQTQMEANSRQLEELNTQIIRLQKQIDEKKEVIRRQKEILTQLIQAYYEYTRQSDTSLLLTRNATTSFMSQKDRLTQTGSKINDLLDSVNELKTKMEDQIAELEQKKIKVVNLHYSLDNQNIDLQDTMQSKQNLLSQTKGEESRYAQLLARVEEQKQQLLDIDELSIAAGLSADSYEKPPAQATAPLAWFFSQKDSRWGNTMIGNSNSSMKNYGCAVASVAMVFVNHGAQITPKTLAKQPIFSWDLIAWPASWSSPSIKLAGSGVSHGNINWSTIDSEIKKSNPVIVYIKKSNGGGGHYVVVHHKAANGKYVVHDPYFGPNIYLDTSRALVGLMGSNSSTIMDQMIIYK